MPTIINFNSAMAAVQSTMCFRLYFGSHFLMGMGYLANYPRIDKSYGGPSLVSLRAHFLKKVKYLLNLWLRTDSFIPLELMCNVCQEDNTSFRLQSTQHQSTNFIQCK